MPSRTHVIRRPPESSLWLQDLPREALLAYIGNLEDQLARYKHAYACKREDFKGLSEANEMLLSLVRERPNDTDDAQVSGNVPHSCGS